MLRVIHPFFVLPVQPGFVCSHITSWSCSVSDQLVFILVVSTYYFWRHPLDFTNLKLSMGYIVAGFAAQAGVQFNLIYPLHSPSRERDGAPPFRSIHIWHVYYVFTPLTRQNPQWSLLSWGMSHRFAGHIHLYETSYISPENAARMRTHDESINGSSPPFPKSTQWSESPDRKCCQE